MAWLVLRGTVLCLRFGLYDCQNCCQRNYVSPALLSHSCNWLHRIIDKSNSYRYSSDTSRIVHHFPRLLSCLLQTDDSAIPEPILPSSYEYHDHFTWKPSIHVSLQWSAYQMARIFAIINLRSGSCHNDKHSNELDLRCDRERRG